MSAEISKTTGTKRPRQADGNTSEDDANDAELKARRRLKFGSPQKKQQKTDHPVEIQNCLLDFHVVGCRWMQTMFTPIEFPLDYGTVVAVLTEGQTPLLTPSRVMQLLNFARFSASIYREAPDDVKCPVPTGVTQHIAVSELGIKSIYDSENVVKWEDRNSESNRNYMFHSREPISDLKAFKKKLRSADETSPDCKYYAVACNDLMARCPHPRQRQQFEADVRAAFNDKRRVIVLLSFNYPSDSNGPRLLVFGLLTRIGDLESPRSGWPADWLVADGARDEEKPPLSSLPLLTTPSSPSREPRRSSAQAKSKAKTKAKPKPKAKPQNTKETKSTNNTSSSSSSSASAASPTPIGSPDVVQREVRLQQKRGAEPPPAAVSKFVIDFVRDGQSLGLATAVASTTWQSVRSVLPPAAWPTRHNDVQKPSVECEVQDKDGTRLDMVYKLKFQNKDLILRHISAIWPDVEFARFVVHLPPPWQDSKTKTVVTTTTTAAAATPIEE